MTSSLTLDLCGLNCPLPLLRTKKTLATLNSGQKLSIKATDKGTPHDLAEFCKMTGHQLLSSREENGIFFFEIQCK